jgi:DNA-binding SARP family transcriptional activator/tetratricopeptide (TPR) repeat protein
MADWLLLTLGETRLRRGEGEALRGRRKALALLVYLAHRSPAAVSRAALAALMWPDHREVRARHSLRQALHDLRKIVGAALEISPESVRVVPGGVRLDISEMEADIAGGDYESAVARWGGDFLDGFEVFGDEVFRGWLEAERERTRRLVAGALERLVELAEGGGEWMRAVVWAERWAASDRYSERAHACLAKALRLSGRREEAATVLAGFVTRIRSELGVEPSAELLREQVPAGGERTDRLTRGGGSAAIFTPDMVGRAALFARLVEAWRAVEQGAGRVVAVGGEEGVGKTRLAEEFLNWVRSSGTEALVLTARAYPAERETDWAAARDLFAPLADAPGLGGAPDDALASLSTIVPGVGNRFPRLSAASPASALDLATGAVLSAVAFELPIVLLVDDFPAADGATRHLLLALARRVPRGVLLVVTGRWGEGDFGGAADPLREVEHVGWMSLPRLSATETEAMLDSMLALHPADRRELAHQLHMQADGNPFYIVSLVLALSDAELLAPDSRGVWRLEVGDDPIPIPRSIHDAVRARIEHLSPTARRLLDAAAVLDRRVESEVLEAMAPEPRDGFREALEELVSRRLLRPMRDRRYRFPNELVRRIVNEQLSPAQQQRLRDAAQAGLAGVGVDEPRGPSRRDWSGRPGLLRRRARSFGLAASVVGVIASGLLVRGGGRGEVATHVRPPAAELQYMEGLAALNRGDALAAEQFFANALRHDSTFALAAYRLRSAREALGQRVAGDTVLTRSIRWIDAAPESERLLTRALWADALQEPARFALAESLVVRYPRDPEAHLILGRARRSRGEFLAAIPHLRRVIELDTLGLDGLSAQCRACDAYREGIEAYNLADSAGAANRWAREWTERQPSSPRAWNTLADQMLARHHYAEAVAAKRTAVTLKPGAEIEPLFRAHLALRAGDRVAADQLLRRVAEGAAGEDGQQALWWLTISLREQGRLREALEVARRYRAQVAATHAASRLGPRAVPYTALIEGQVLFEQGRYAEAAALFDSIGLAAEAPESPGSSARALAWALTHKATALARGGDTAAVLSLADHVREIGVESGYGRDWRLHHYVRGLALVLQGDTAEAEREFRAAIYSVSGGFSRVNLELARILRASGRADEAVSLLEAALRGPIDGSGLYLTRSKLRLELARALHAAGRSEQASEHLAWVARAWERADPEYRRPRELPRRSLAAPE